MLTLRIAAGAIAAITVWLTGSIARRLGAGAYGELLAMAAMGLAPGLLAIASFYSMNVLDVLIWTLSARIVIGILDRPALSRWIVLGIVLGLGLETKIDVLWLGAGLAAGLLLTPARRVLLTPGPWVAAVVAGLLVAPHLLWQISHDWPTLEFIRNASQGKMQTKSPVTFVVEQIVTMNPVLLPVWLGGLLFFCSRELRPVPAARHCVSGGRGYRHPESHEPQRISLARLSDVICGGRCGPGAIGRCRVWRLAIIGVVLVTGAISAPLALPLLSVDRYVGYSRALGIAPSTEERKELGRLPQFFADRQGWDRFVDQIAAAFDRLSPAERASAAVFVGNYGEAGAIELLGRSRGLVAISGHNNYWLWGPQGRTGAVLIVLSRSRERQDQLFSSVEQVGEIDCGDCMPYENHQMIFIDRGLKPPLLSERWPQLKHYE